MNEDDHRVRKYGYAFDNMMMTSLPGSIWEYPYPDQYASFVVYSMFDTAPPDPSRRDPPFPAKNRIPQMDSPSRFEPTTKTAKMHQHAAGETTELGEVVISTATSSVATSAVHANSDAAPCKNGGCKIWRSSRSGSEPRSESPWHLLKTIFFISVIVAFLLWIIVYTLLDQYRIL